MMRRAFLLVAVTLAATGGQARAQFIVGPPPDPGFPYGGGVRFVYRSGNLAVTGSFGGYYGPAIPYGYYPAPVIQRTTVVIPPPRINVTNNFYGGQPPVLGGGYAQDTRGVDLDLVPFKKPVPRDIAEEPEAKPAKPLPGVEVSKPVAPVRPGDNPPPPPQPQPQPPLRFPSPPEALADPRDEAARLIQQGLEAFKEGQYGLAAQRFGLAAQLDPALSQARFFQAQAQFAMGKYRQAVDAIEAGIKLDARWPLQPIQPRLDLYKGRDAAYQDHVRQLTDAVAAQPNRGTLLFLLAHQLWFDGQRKDALALFLRARPLMNDPRPVDAFLLAGGPGAIAAR